MRSSSDCAVVVAQLVVELALGGLQVAVERLLGLLGQVLGDLLLGPAEDERPQGAWPAVPRVSSSALPAADAGRLKTRGACRACRG